VHAQEAVWHLLGARVHLHCLIIAFQKQVRHLHTFMGERKSQSSPTAFFTRWRPKHFGLPQSCQAEFIGKIRLLGGKLPTSLLTSAAFLKI
jgi:hypothetical protein